MRHAPDVGGLEHHLECDALLPSSISASADTSLRARLTDGAVLLRATHEPASSAGPRLLGRGPLARASLRLLGIGATGQAFASWSQPATGRVFGTGPGAAGIGQAWLAARSLPTPNGYYRAGFVR